EMGDKLKKAGESMVATGKTLSTHLTVPLTALGTLAAKSAIDFESAFAGVRKTVHATEAEFAALERGIRDMASEIPAAATEIAGVAEAAGQLGIQNEHILSFTRTMIDLGESTNMSAEQAATSLARLANITQMPQSEFDRLGSTIVALGNNLATTEAEIVEMGLRLAGAGKQIGMTEAEILSFAGALSSVGIAAEAGGSAFSKVMIQMQLAAETGGAALDNFARVAGMSAEQFARQFRENAAEALIAFINGLQQTEEQGISAIKVLDDIGITEVRMRDALLRAAGAGELFAESIKLGTQAWEENTALTNEAAQRYETTASKLEIMRNRLQDVAITFGEILLPPLVAVAEKVGEFADWLAGLDPRIKTTIVVVGGLAAALGPVLIVLGQIVSSIGTLMPLLGTLAAFIKTTLIPAIAGISLPTVATVAAIAALAVVAYEVYRAWDEVKAALSATWEYMKASAEKLALNMSLSFEKMKVTVIGVVDEILERLSILESLPFGIGDSFAGLREKVSGSVDASRQKITELEAALEANSVRMAEAAEGMKVSWGDVGAKVAEDIQLVINKITGQTEVMAAELDEQTEIVETEWTAQTDLILQELDTQLQAITDVEQEKTKVITDEANKQAEARAKFEADWNQKLFNLQADRLEKLEAEYKAALAMAEELEADKTAIHEYYRILREQYDEEQRKKEEEERKKREAAEKQALERRTAFEEEYQKKLVELTSEGAKSRLEVLGDEYSEALKKAEELGADTTAVHEYYWLLREKVLEEEREAEERAFQERLNLLKSWQDRLIEATATEEELLRIKAEKAIEQIREQMAEEIKLAEGHNEAIAAIRAYWAVEEQKVWEEYYEALTASAKKAAEEREALEAEWSNKLLELQLSETEKRLKALDEAEREAIAQAEKVQADITAIQQYYAILRTQIFQEEEKKKQDIARKAQEEREAYEEAWRKKERDRALQAAGDRIQILVQEYLDELKIAEQKGADTAYITRYYQALIAEERQKQAEELAKIAEEEAEKEAKAAEEKLQARQKFEQEWNDKLFKATADRITILERERDEQIRIATELGANTHSIRAYYEKLITDELDRQAKERERRAEEEAKKHQSIWERAGVTIENVCKKIASDFSAMIEHNFNVEQDYVKKREELQEDIKKQLEELDRKRQEELESVGDNAEKKLE
ncbi:phage tail tape measure protein, partial [Candidatus Darwinibacter acetoxidans]